jgi:hypothetical protein
MWDEKIMTVADVRWCITVGTLDAKIEALFERAEEVACLQQSFAGH